jgi:hypothetical protein
MVIPGADNLLWDIYRNSERQLPAAFAKVRPQLIAVDDYFE